MTNISVVASGSSVSEYQQFDWDSPAGGIKITHSYTRFPDDYIIVFDVVGASPEGELTSASGLVGVRVYRSVSDYLSDTPKWVYSTPPGQQAAVISGVTGMGDTYVRFANNPVLRPETVGADWLGELFIAPGVNLSAATWASPIIISQYTDVDYNGNNTIDAGTTEVGNGRFSAQNGLQIPVVCVTRGTLILTPAGPVAVECLSAGDLVMTRDEGALPIRWIGSRRVAGAGRYAPVRIRAGALGNLRDLNVSQNHRMLVSGPRAELLYGEAEVLVAAKHLVNGGSIRIIPQPEVEYFHFLFDSHQIVWAECCPTESLYPGTEALKGLGDESREEILGLFPELRDLPAAGSLSRYALNRHEASLWRLSA